MYRNKKKQYYLSHKQHCSLASYDFFSVFQVTNRYTSLHRWIQEWSVCEGKKRNLCKKFPLFLYFFLVLTSSSSILGVFLADIYLGGRKFMNWKKHAALTVEIMMTEAKQLKSVLILQIKTNINIKFVLALSRHSKVGTMCHLFLVFIPFFWTVRNN